MITIRAQNSALLDMNEGFSYLIDNYNSDVGTLVVTNIASFAADDPVLIGQFGSETAEIVYIESVNTDTNTLTLENNTKFAHPESTRVSKLRYSMVEFLWGDGPDYDALGSPATSQDIPALLGDSSTQWNITTSGGRTTYTWSGTGTDPRITDYFDYPLPSAGSLTKRGWINSPNFNSSNNVTSTTGALIYEVGEDFFTLVHTGVNQAGVTTGAGYIKLEVQFIDVTADQYHTLFRDEVLTTGFGYFRWWNPRSHIGTIVKSPIPYLGFPANSAKSIIDDFFSTLNSKELKLVSREDAFRWLSEGYSVALNELNLVNKEYGEITPYAIETVSGTREYALPANCSRISRVWNLDDDVEISATKYDKTNEHEAWNNTSTLYYLRGVKDLEVPDYNAGMRLGPHDAAELYIGFTPEPTAAVNIQIKYLPKAVPIVKNYDAIFMPNNNFYFLKDFMMFRAAPKLGRGTGEQYYGLFQNEINRMKANAYKQDNKLDSFSIASSANV